MSRYNNYTGKNAKRQSAKYYAMRYNEFLDEYNSLKDSVGAVNYDGMPHGTTVGNPTEHHAIRREQLAKRMEVIESTAHEIDNDLYPFIMRYTTQGVSYEYLYACDGLYVSKRTFLRKVGRFYESLSEKLGIDSD